MKTTLRAFILGIALIAILTGASNESGARMKLSPTYKELIIQIPELNEKNVFDARKNLESNGGLVFRGHCNELDVLLYLVDVNVHANYDFVGTSLQPLSMTYELKEGTIADLQLRCGLDNNIPVSEQQ